jgi:hypothetical protein
VLLAKAYHGIGVSQQAEGSEEANDRAVRSLRESASMRRTVLGASHLDTICECVCRRRATHARR